MYKPCGQWTTPRSPTFRMLIITVFQPHPEKIVVHRTRKWGKLWKSNLDMAGSACLGCLYDLNISRCLVYCACLQLTWTSTYRQHGWVSLIQLQHGLLAVKPDTWELSPIQMLTEVVTQFAEATGAQAIFQLFPSVPNREVRRPEFEPLALGTRALR